MIRVYAATSMHTRRAPLASAAAVALWFLLSGPATSHAQDAMSGTWRYAGSEAERAQREEAVRAATEPMSFLIRGTARDRLMEATAPRPRIHVAVAGDRVELRADGSPRVVLTVGGPEVTVEGERGRGRMRATRRSGLLTVTAQGERGTRTATYQISEDGGWLYVDVHLRGDRLPEPLVYRLTYRRE